MAAAQEQVALAELFTVLGQPAEVRRRYERAVALARPAARSEPDNALAQRELAFAARGLGQAYLREGQAGFARNLSNEGHAAAVAWAKIDPQDRRARREEMVCLALVADACAALHDLPGARVAAEQMIATVEGYAGAEPKDLLGRFDLADAWAARARVELLDYNFAEALPWIERALGIFRPLGAAGQLKPFPREAARRDELERAAAECRSILKTIDDINVALKEPPDTALRWLLGRAGALARRGRPAEAAATAEKMRQLKPKDAINLYNVACCYGLCAAAVGTGQPADALTPEEKALRAEYVARALKDLRAAAEHGFRNVEKIESDPDLAPLRSEAGYRALLAELKVLRAWVTFPVPP